MLDFLLHKRHPEWATQVSLFYVFGAVSSKEAGLVITERGDKSKHRNTSLGKPVESYTSLRIPVVFSRLQLYWLIVGEMFFWAYNQLTATNVRFSENKASHITILQPSTWVSSGGLFKKMSSLQLMSSIQLK